MFSFLPNSHGFMVGPKHALSLALALLAGALAVPGPAAAQCRLCATPETQRVENEGKGPMQLEVEARLDFDQLMLLDTAGRGVARLNPDGSRTTSGAIGAMTARTMVGSVVIRGEPGRPIRIDLPTSVILYGRVAGTITLTKLVSDLPAAPRLDSQGQLTFRFGGELEVQGTSEGDYTGDVPITVDYL